MAYQNSSLVFNSSSLTDTTLSYSNDPHRPLYRVETKKTDSLGLSKATSIYRLAGPGQSTHRVGYIELHTLSSDVVTSHNSQDVRPSTASSFGLGSSKQFQGTDGQSYKWKWKKHVGWTLRDIREHEIASFNDGANRLSFAQPVHDQLQMDIIVTAIYLEQRRRKDAETTKTAKAGSEASDLMALLV